MPSPKAIAARVLEGHPFGYVAGVFLLDHLDALLPHEADYHGFSKLAAAHGFAPKAILDVGANRGHSARAFLKLLPGWKVISLEANPLHERRLATIAARHPDRFSFRIGAVTDRPKGDVDFFTPVYRGAAMHSAAAMSHKEALGGVEGAFPHQKGRFEVVRTVTPTLSIDSLGVDASFAKIDIQGEELNALKGMSGLIERCKPVLLIEMNLTRDDLAAHLAALGYAPWRFDPVTRSFSRRRSEYSVHARNQFFIHPDSGIAVS